jgi:hypothetical protein
MRTKIHWARKSQQPLAVVWTIESWNCNDSESTSISDGLCTTDKKQMIYLQIELLLTSQNLSPIRKLAYIFDRRHFGMIGSVWVTLCDTSLDSEWALRRGKTAGGKGRETSREGVFRGRHGPWHVWQPLTGPPAMPVTCVQGWLPKICHPPVLETAAGACAWVHLVGKWACPTDAHFLVPRLCHAPSSKIDI